jgi:hypothetical protein
MRHRKKGLDLSISIKQCSSAPKPDSDVSWEVKPHRKSYCETKEKKTRIDNIMSHNGYDIKVCRSEVSLKHILHTQWRKRLQPNQDRVGGGEEGGRHLITDGHNRYFSVSKLVV